MPSLAAEPAIDQPSDVLEEVVVRAHPLSGEGLAQPVEILQGEALLRNLSASVGETVGRLPGVQNAPFGQASGRPVIHGLGGARVRVMEDRIDSLDASVTSTDHAVAIESFLVEEIEILKGPSTLLYGTGAVGGVVDMHTARIPHASVTESLVGRVELRGADNADLRQGAFRVDGGGERFAVHLDGFFRDADEYDIPGFAESAAQRAAEAAEEAEEGSFGEEEEEEVRGTAPGTQLEQRGGALGASYLGDRGFIGVSVSMLEADYGLPGGHEHEHDEEGGEEEEGEGEEEEGNPTLDMEQVRFDLEAGLKNPFAGFRSANFRFGYNDYEHVEIEPSGEVGTQFSNEAWELRFELVHEMLLGFEGAIGLQVQQRDFAAIGEEAFVPPVNTDRAGVFWVGERKLGGAELELGLRLEQVEHDPSEGASRDFSVWAASAGFNVPLDQGWRLGVVADLATRAPVAEELFSNGPHLATQSFDVGDATLDEEGVFGFALTLQRSGERAGMSVTVYANAFSDFIVAEPTGEEEDGLAVFAYRQDDAFFAGVDFSAYWRPVLWEGGWLSLRTQFDTVQASIDGGPQGDDEPPRLPAQRFGFGLEVKHRGFSADLDLLEVREQNSVAALELPTDGYQDLRASVNYTLPVGANDRLLQLFLQGRNLTDDEQRLHTSFIKDFTPLPGRTIEAGVRLSF